MKSLVLTVCITLFLGEAFGTETVKTVKQFTLSSGLHCLGIFREPKIQQPEGLPILLSLNGSGAYSMQSDDEINQVASYFLYQGKVAVLSIEKPGVKFVDGRAEVDVMEFYYFTQLDLMECADAALSWASGGANRKIYLQGHSEGAEVLSRLYTKLLQTDRGHLVEMLILSGVPMDPMDEIIRYQLQNNPSRLNLFLKALAEKDEQTLQSITEGLGSNYWAEILKAESLYDTLVKIGSKDPSAVLEIYQGLSDRNTRVERVIDFEAQNIKKKSANEAAWFLEARYYNAGHSLNRAAIDDMVFLLNTYLK